LALEHPPSGAEYEYLFFSVLSPPPLTSHCFSVTGNIGYSVAQK
jgi:hypothetical protein